MGKPVLMNSSKDAFKKAKLDGCTKNFKANCEEVLNNLGIEKENQRDLLNVVFGEDGLVEVEDKNELQEKMDIAMILLDEIERSILLLGPDKETIFSTFITSREKNVLRKLIGSSRRQALRNN